MSNPEKPPEEPTSSFPMSSPSFWTEAAGLGLPLPDKRSRSTSPSVDIKDDTLANLTLPSPPSSPPNKRARFDATTTLSYLPNRLDPFIDNDPHSYLANPEYAPNRFGDIGDYLRKKEVKVQTQNRDIALAAASEGIPQIFANVSFFINGNTHPPMEELRKMILQRGGEVRPKLHNKGLVKFIIAPMLTQSKFKQFERYKVVREGWIVECCKEGRLLDWSRWKLQPEGGWEQGSRKGLEGFFAGKWTQAAPTSGSVLDQKDNMLEEVIPIKETTPPRSLEPVALSAATQSLLRPVSSTIPISPGAKRDETPMKETLPAKVQKPEGGWWESYYSKEPNEDAARLMKDKEWRLKNTAERGNEGGFIDGYYQNSRLHHLSTWKAELRVLVAAAQHQSEEQSMSKPSQSGISPFSLATSALPRFAPTNGKPGERVIFHVDFDCFFVSCGLATRPHLKGKPSVVCHSQVGKSAASTSEIASASYEARAKGVKNGMSLGKARQLVGDELETIPYEFETYKRFSLAFYTVLMGYADELQAVSVDEALIDVTSAVAARAAAPEEARAEDPSDRELSVRKPRDPAVEVAEKIRDEVRGLTQGCEVSIGIAHNILLAKLGTRRAKPAGVFHVFPADVEPLLAPLTVEDLPSIGYSIRGKIEDKFGTSVCGELLVHPKGAFKAVLGPKTGEMLWGYLRGIDERKLEPHKERKSISAEMNYGIRFQNQSQAEICIADLAAEVSKRMKQVNAKGRLLTLKLMSRHPDAPIEPPKFLGHGWCETTNKSVPIGNRGGSATDNAEILATESVKLLRAMRLDPNELRGVGIQITKLDSDKAVEREVGQSTLSFGAKRKRENLVTRRSDTPVSIEAGPSSDTAQPPTVEEVDDLVEEVEARPSSPVTVLTDVERSPSPEVVQKPEPALRSSPPLTRRQASLRDVQAGPSKQHASSDGIDPDFLAALPLELRQEVKRDFALIKQAANPVPPPPKDHTRERSATESPTKAAGKHAAAHITRQLRPKVKTQMKATAIAAMPLYGAWAKAQERETTVDLTAEDEDEEEVCGYRVSELRDLGLHPEVFCELPEDMRKEVIAEERRKHRQRKVLHRPADTFRLRANQRESTRTASLSPGKSSRAGTVPPHRPLAAVSLPPKPSLLKATALPDVLETVTRWIDSRKGGPPADRDAGKVKTYLVKCLDKGTGVGGAENAVEVLKWMRMELKARWPEDENGEDGAGKVWWLTWRGFVGIVNELAVKRFGAPLRL